MGPVRRRTFLAWAIGGAIAACVAAVATVVGVFLTPSESEAPAVRIPKRLGDLVDGDVVPVQAPPGWALVIADGGGANKAGGRVAAGFVVRTCGSTEVLAATCSHLGCTLNYESARSRFECPCHGSTFEASCAVGGKSVFGLDGDVVHGPAAFPMAHIRWQRSAAPDELLLNMVRTSVTS